jgi:hypothetical protein
MTNSRAYVPQTNFLVDCQSNRGLSKRKMGNGFASEAEDWRAGNLRPQMPNIFFGILWQIYF